MTIEWKPCHAFFSCVTFSSLTVLIPSPHLKLMALLTSLWLKRWTPSIHEVVLLFCCAHPPVLSALFFNSRSCYSVSCHPMAHQLMSQPDEPILIDVKSLSSACLISPILSNQLINELTTSCWHCMVLMIAHVWLSRLNVLISLSDGGWYLSI